MINFNDQNEFQYLNFKHVVSKNGSLIFSDVMAFMERKHNVTTKYKLITTLLNQTISLTGNHPLYTRRRSTEKFSARQVICCSSVIESK